MTSRKIGRLYQIYSGWREIVATLTSDLNSNLSISVRELCANTNNQWFGQVFPFLMRGGELNADVLDNSKFPTLFTTALSKVDGVKIDESDDGSGTKVTTYAYGSVKVSVAKSRDNRYRLIFNTPLRNLPKGWDKQTLLRSDWSVRDN